MFVEKKIVIWCSIISAISKEHGNWKCTLLVVGWEYGVNPTYGVYGPVMKAYHMCRRRRLVRSRELVDVNATKKQVNVFFNRRAKKYRFYSTK